MDHFDKNIKSKLKEHADKHVSFTAADRNRIIQQVRRKQKERRHFQPVYLSVLTLTALFTILLTLSLIDTSKQQVQEVQNALHEVALADRYEGRELTIGAIGELPDFSFDHVVFREAKPADLRENSGEYNAFFITEEYFKELSTDEWTAVFQSISTPVFFLNNNYNAVVFQSDGIDYREGAWESTKNTEGFVGEAFGETDIMSWGYGSPTPSEAPADVPAHYFHLMFKDIEKYWASVNVDTIAAQLENLQPDFTKIISETETQYGKLVFYGLTNEEHTAEGVGLALFQQVQEDWLYMDGTASTVTSVQGITGSSDRIELPNGDSIQYSYRYNNSEPLNHIEQIDALPSPSDGELGAIYYTLPEKNAQ